MTTEVRWRKGTTAQHSTFTGALGEVTVDTTKKTVVVHDGATAGGTPLATAASLTGKQDTLVSGTNIKTINGTSILGAGNLAISTTGGSVTNYVHNSAFKVNQRAVTGTVTLAAGQRGHDRWKAGTAGCTYTFSSSGSIVTITISAGSLIQTIDAGSVITTGTFCLSWTGTAQGKIGAGAYGASGVTGTVTAGTNIDIEFNTGTLTKVQLEEGNAVSTYQGTELSREMNRCQFYLPATSGSCPHAFGLSTNTTLGYVVVNFANPVRTAPTGLTVIGGFNTLNGAGASTAITSLAYNSAGITSAMLTLNGTGLTAAGPVIVVGTGASSTLLFTGAEL